MDDRPGVTRRPTTELLLAHRVEAAVVRSMLAQHVQGLRLVVLALVILAYLAVDGAMLARHETHIQWDMRVDARGIITWLDPNGPASDANLQVGDRVLPNAGAAGMQAAALDQQPILRVRHLGQVRVVRADPVFGSSVEGQLLVLLALPMLLIGGLTWAAGGRRAPPALLAVLSAAMALSLLGDAWAHDGIPWAMRLTAVAAPMASPLAWAALFLTFPHNRLRARPWRVSLIVLSIVTAAAVVMQILRIFIVLPHLVVVAMTAPILPAGLLLGLAGLCLRMPGETLRTRQQRRLVGLAAVGAVAPFLLLSFVPMYIPHGHPFIPFEAAAFAFLLLPLGLAYAMARYDLMEVDAMVRRLVAVALATVALLIIAVSLSLALDVVLPTSAVVVVAVCLVVGARRTVDRWTKILTERLLSPELVRSRALLSALDAAALRSDADLPALAGELEAAMQVVSRVSRCRFLVRRFPGTTFAAPQATAAVAAPALTASLPRRAWGLTARDVSAPEEWALLATELDATPTLIMPVLTRGEVIGLVLLGERDDGEPLRGPDREALALLIKHLAPALDYARIRADLEGKLADAAMFSAASARLTASLGEWDTLVGTIAESLADQPGIQDVAIFLAGSDAQLEIIASHGEVDDLTPQPLAQAKFSLSPQPVAWLPLHAGAAPIGALQIRWQAGYAVDEHTRQFLSIFASSVAMALEHARLYQQARIHAERDPVTDLYNHRAFHARLERSLSEARRTSGHAGILLIDLVNFKLFNDTHGHQAGDLALRQVSEVLQACCQAPRLAARLGGDEFAVLLPGADRDAAYAMAERLTTLAEQSALSLPEGDSVPLRLSIGVASFPQDAEAINTLLARADERMYEAKRAGITVSRGAHSAFETGASSAHFGLLEALVAMVDNHDRYTAEHSEQVADYACALGEALGLSHRTIDTLRIAGLLHDVGKIGVPDRILRKPGRLSDEELEIVRRHVELSEALITITTRDLDLINAVAYHHERWDGTGYPRRAAGEAVPLLGRIMIVADAVSAMAMDRPYRKGLTWEAISTELVRCSGGQFDPALVPVALHALRPLIKAALKAPA